jgi:hypothetical protein
MTLPFMIHILPIPFAQLSSLHSPYSSTHANSTAEKKNREPNEPNSDVAADNVLAFGNFILERKERRQIWVPPPGYDHDVVRKENDLIENRFGRLRATRKEKVQITDEQPILMAHSFQFGFHSSPPSVEQRKKQRTKKL